MQTEQRSQSTFNLSLLWFGVSVSIAEIITGAMLAPLGFTQGFAAILLGHAIGLCILLLVGLVGATSGFSTSQVLRGSFGQYGAGFFSFLNILQLVGWAAVMTISGAKTLNSLTIQLAGYQNETVLCLGIGALNFVWVLLGLKHIFKVNIVVVTTLFFASLFLGYKVFTQTGSVAAVTQPLSFGAAVELNVAMVLSWLALIADYTRTLKRPVTGTVACVLSYGCGSVLMFLIGLGAAMFAGTADIGHILLAAGFGILALVVIVFSTLTTTFMDTYSVGVNGNALYGRIPPKVYSSITCVVATAVAVLVPMSQYENFLYLIGSVFSPLFAIVLVDFFLLGKKTTRDLLCVKNSVLWLLGFTGYRFFMDYNSIVGVSLPVMLGTACLCLAVNTLTSGKRA